MTPLRKMLQVMLLSRRFDTMRDAQNTFSACTVCNISSAGGFWSPRLDTKLDPLAQNSQHRPCCAYIGFCSMCLTLALALINAVS